MSDGQSSQSTLDLDVVLGTRRVVAVMGTVFTLDVRGLDPAGEAVDHVIAWWRWVDDTFSTYRDRSQVSRLADGSLSLDECAPEVRHVLDLCAHASAASQGYFTDHPGGVLDPSGMVKGWSVECAGHMLRAAGSDGYCISAGGDVRCAGVPEPGGTWTVGVADPLDPSGLVATIPAPGSGSRDLAVATSGIAERGLHIIDPLTGRRAHELLSITVVGADITVADWVATAAFAMGNRSRTWLESLSGVDALALLPDGGRWCTSAWRY